VDVDLSVAAEPLAVEWCDPVTGTNRAGKPVSGGGKRTLQSPWSGPAVLLLRQPT
jgi:hypothetical protein